MKLMFGHDILHTRELNLVTYNTPKGLTFQEYIIFLKISFNIIKFRIGTERTFRITITQTKGKGFEG